MIHWNMIFSDETGNFCTPAEPEKGEKVALRLRAAKGDFLKVSLCSGQERTPMRRRQEKEGAFDFYEGVTPPLWEPFPYHYEIYEEKDNTENADSESIRYFNRLGLVAEADPAFDFCLIPGFCVPEWMKGAVIYQIYVDRFCRGNARTDVQTGEFCYLAGRHLTVIPEDKGRLLYPTEADNRNAERYRKRTTDPVNLEASDAYFAHFIEEAHRRGIRVIMDGVFNHCGSFHKWLDREKLYEQQGGYAPGAYVSGESPYRDFFAFQNQEAWPDNGSYEGWWGFETLPKLNYEGSQELWNYVLDIGRKWVSPPYNVDGWRLDVAADLGHSPEVNHRFWKEFRKAVKEANPNAVILAEHYGDPKSWLLGDEWDTIMNYDAFMEPITWFLTGMEKHSDEYRGECFGNPGDFEGAMRHHMTRFMTSSLQCAMNELSNHDQSRFLTRTNKKVGRAEQLGTDAAGRGINKGVMKEAVVFQMTWPGAPTLYYGDEAGQVGFTDPDNRRTYPWGSEDMDLLNFHREMIRIHKEHEAFKTGSIQFVWGEYNFLCYARYNRREHFLVVLNNDAVSRSVEMVVWPVGLPKECELEQIMYSHEGGFSTNPVTYEVKGGKLNITLTEFSAVVLRLKETSGEVLPE